MHHVTPLQSRFSLGELVKKIETSATALKKRLRTARRKIKKVTQEHRRIAKAKGLYATAVTLTYSNDAAFSQKHVTKFINCLRAKLKRQGHSLLYVWVLERASAIHYHLALWLPHGFTLNHSDLARWWTWGSTWTQACRKVSAWIRYLSKRDDKTNLPSSARLFGCGGMDEAARAVVTLTMLPRWLTDVLPNDAKPRRIAGIGWTDMTTGTIYPSPWMWTPHGARLK